MALEVMGLLAFFNYFWNQIQNSINIFGFLSRILYICSQKEKEKCVRQVLLLIELKG